MQVHLVDVARNSRYGGDHVHVTRYAQLLEVLDPMRPAVLVVHVRGRFVECLTMTDYVDMLSRQAIKTELRCEQTATMVWAHVRDIPISRFLESKCTRRGKICFPEGLSPGAR
jgi:hypothetical protein